MRDKLDVLKLNSEAWDKIASKFEKERPEWLEKQNPLFRVFCASLPKDGNVLDVGSGTGLPYDKLLAEMGFKVFGIDISLNMVNIAQKNVPDARFKQLSMTEINFAQSFDGILSSFSMLLVEPEKFKDVAKRISQALKNGGIFYLSLNEPWEEGVDIDCYEYTIIEIMGEKMYSRPYSEQEINEIFSPLGMKILRIHREMIVSELFGTEHTISFIIKKQ